VDIFSPNAAELAFMLQPEQFQLLTADSGKNFLSSITPEMLHEWTAILLDWGVKLILVKLGERGLYLRTAKVKSWERAGRGLSELSDQWIDRELWAPAFKVTVRGTTGAGDAATGGFLASLLRGQGPERSLDIAAGVGGISVGQVGCGSEAISWEDILERIELGWAVRPLDLAAYGWQQANAFGIWQRG
jgi:sugar/nucleoside kinase (ribokinase family)